MRTNHCSETNGSMTVLERSLIGTFNYRAEPWADVDHTFYSTLILQDDFSNGGDYNRVSAQNVGTVYWTPETRDVTVTAAVRSLYETIETGPAIHRPRRKTGD